MNNRITKCFSKAQREGRTAFVAYLTVGYPTLEESELAVDRLIDEGTDIIELGIPFSDPFADGAVIRAAAYEALKGGVTLGDAIALASRVRSRHPDTPLVVFSYYNVILSYGNDNFAAMAEKAGIDSVLVVDLPLEERDELLAAIKPHGIAMIPLIAPNTPLDRVAASACGVEDGFLYVITVKGVTGVRGNLPPELTERLDEIRRTVNMPMVAGFGIASRKQGESLAKGHAEGYVIGSAIVERLGANGLASKEPLV